MGEWGAGGGPASIFPWVSSISSAYFCQVLGDEANYLAIYLLALFILISLFHPLILLAPRCTSMYVVCVWLQMNVCPHARKMVYRKAVGIMISVLLDRPI